MPGGEKGTATHRTPVMRAGLYHAAYFTFISLGTNDNLGSL